MSSRLQMGAGFSFSEVTGEEHFFSSVYLPIPLDLNAIVTVHSMRSEVCLTEKVTLTFVNLF